MRARGSLAALITATVVLSAPAAALASPASPASPVTPQRLAAAAKVTVSTGTPLAVSVDTRSSRIPRGDRIRSATVDFGDRTRLVRLRVARTRVAHHYGAAGTYRVKVVLRDVHGRTSSVVRRVSVADGSAAPVSATGHPVASLSFDTHVGPAQKVSADSTVADASGSAARAGTTLVSGTIDYGDGTTTPLAGDSAAWVDDHTYGDAGVYVATLSVVESDGQQAVTSVVLTVFDAPTVSLAVQSTSLLAGSPVVLSVDSATPAGTAWQGGVVDWGDGTGQQGFTGAPPATISHTYAQPGAYDVAVGVQNDLEGSGSDTVHVVVL